MRERAKRANLETHQANEILQKFKQLEVEREKEAMAAIEGEPGIASDGGLGLWFAGRPWLELDRWGLARLPAAKFLR